MAGRGKRSAGNPHDEEAGVGEEAGNGGRGRACQGADGIALERGEEVAEERKVHRPCAARAAHRVGRRLAEAVSDVLT